MSGASSLAGARRFAGEVIIAAELRHDVIADGLVIGCLGTDEAMLEVVSDLVGRGLRVKVFEDRPRRVLPRRRLGILRRAEVLAVAGDALGAARRAATVTGLGAIGRPIGALQREVDDRSASALRHRQVPDRWTRRQLTPLPFDRRPPVRHDHYLRAVASLGCDFVTWPVASVTLAGIRTCDGIEHRLDLLVVAA